MSALPASAHPPIDARTGAALLAVYLIWGTTYLAVKFALASFAPFWQMGSRFVVAGGLLFAWLALRGAPWPTARQWRDSAIVGALMLGGGMGLVATGQQWISSGATTVLIAVMPVWLALWQGAFGRWPARRDWLGIALGTAGVVVLASGAEFRASPAGLAAIVGATLCWSLGSVLSTRLDVPKGPMGFAAEMLGGAVALLALSAAAGEPWMMPWRAEPRALAAWGYLIVAGSLLAFSAYMYLMANVRPALAASYTYVNPAVALLVGAWLGAETVAPQTLVALPVILAAVALLMGGRR
ncbi:MAG TPA: drug/metabolite exporter YedA [Burkholderiaceae bacterium]|nr:drug/metabolite exporter YedA [Burkholderiaceae bacterium]